MKNIKPAIVTLDSCHEIVRTKTPFMLLIRKGENLVDSLIKCAEIVKFPSASLSGIGALENPILGKYNFELKKHEPKIFPGIYELTCLTGNIAKRNGKYIVHVHAAITDLKDSDCRTMGGHLINAMVGIIAEITIMPFASVIIKK